MLPVHELALLLPDMTADQRDELKRDIQANGLLDPITTYQGKALDGRHRDAICDELSIKPRYVRYTGSDPAAFVISKNLHRRHLTKPQRDALGAKVAAYFDAEMRKRRSDGGKTGGKTAGRGRPIGSVPNGTLPKHHATATSSAPNDKPKPKRSRATAKAASLVGSSTRNVGRAQRVQKARPDLFAQVQAGNMTVSEAETEVAADKAKAKRSGPNATTRTKAKATAQPQSAPSRPRRAKNWNGKTNAGREREAQEKHRNIRAELRSPYKHQRSDYSRLASLQLAIDRLCTTLEDLSHVPVEYDDAATLLVAHDIHEDLVTLGMWQDRMLSKFQAFVSDTQTRATIAKCRAMTVANGCPPDEAANAQRAIAQLQRKLSNVLVA